MAERTIMISDSINGEMAKNIIEKIIDINEKDTKQEEKLREFKREPINVIVNSFGGSVYDGFGIVDIIRASETPVHTYCMGSAMSMGFIIFLVGHERYAGENCTFMYHEIASTMGGKLEGFKMEVEELTRLQIMLDDIVLDNTSIMKDKLEDYKGRKAEWYISAKEGLKLGICSELI